MRLMTFLYLRLQELPLLVCPYREWATNSVQSSWHKFHWNSLMRGPRNLRALKKIPALEYGISVTNNRLIWFVLFILRVHFTYKRLIKVEHQPRSVSISDSIYSMFYLLCRGSVSPLAETHQRVSHKPHNNNMRAVYETRSTGQYPNLSIPESRRL